MISPEAIRHSQDAARAVWGPNRGRTLNVGQTERTASKIGGGVLIGAGLLRGGFKGLVMAGLGGVLLYRGATGHCALYEAMGADTSDPSLDEYEPGVYDSVSAKGGMRVEESVTINKPRAEVFAFLRDQANMPRFMRWIESVTPLEDVKRSHWVALLPMGVRLQWDSEIHTETPGEMFSWRSLDGSDLDSAGTYRFEDAPGNRGTVVRLNMKLDPPGGKAALALARLAGMGPESLAREDLRRLKQLIETGEIPTVVGQSSGRA